MDYAIALSSRLAAKGIHGQLIFYRWHIRDTPTNGSHVFVTYRLSDGTKWIVDNELPHPKAVPVDATLGVARSRADGRHDVVARCVLSGRRACAIPRRLGGSNGRRQLFQGWAIRRGRSCGALRASPGGGALRFATASWLNSLQACSAHASSAKNHRQPREQTHTDQPS